MGFHMGQTFSVMLDIVQISFAFCKSDGFFRDTLRVKSLREPK